MNIYINQNHGIVPSVGDVGILMTKGSAKAFIPAPQRTIIPPAVYHLYTLSYGTIFKDRGVCTLEDSQGTVDDTYISFYYIHNKKLYCLYSDSLKQESSGRDWKWCSGQTYGTSGLAIDVDGYLYYINSDNQYTPVQIGTMAGWKKVSGTNSGDALAVNEAGLYRIAGSGTSFVAGSIDLNPGWDLPTCLGSTGQGLATKNNSVYWSSGGTATLVDNSTKAAPWTDLTGYINYSYAYGINDGRLYGLYRSGSVFACAQIGTETGWTKVAGYDWNTYSATGIRDGKLYNIYGNTAVLIDDTMIWTDVSGSTTRADSSYNVSNAFAIGDGKLYRRKGLTLTQVGTDNGFVKVYGTIDNNGGSVVAIRRV